MKVDQFIMDFEGGVVRCFNCNSTIPTNIKSYITDKAGDKNEDSSTRDFVKFAKRNKPLKATKDKQSLMFELPVYDSYDQISYDIWGGDKKPFKKEYFVVALGDINVVTFFKSKNEAASWIKHTS